METISLVKDKQKDLNKRVKRIKKGIKENNIKLKENFKRNKHEKKKKFSKKANAVIYLGHIPHGFYEDEMTSYFSQFGKVIRATVARSNKTGRSKGYGFVEFKDEDVAQIAAETMNNYLMFNKILKCRYIPPEERKGKVYVRTISPADYPRKKNRLIDAINKKNAVTKLNKGSYLKKTQKKIEDFRKFFEERGVDFAFKFEESDKSVASKLSADGESNSSEDETDDQFGILEIDESDNEIHFKTPPQVKKVIKKTADLPLTASNTKKGKDKIQKSKATSGQVNLKKSQKIEISKKNIGDENSKFDNQGNLGPKGKQKPHMVKKKSEISEEKLNKKPKILKKSLKKSNKSSGAKVETVKKGAASLLGKSNKSLNESYENLGFKKVRIEKTNSKQDSSKVKSNKFLVKKTPKKNS